MGALGTSLDYHVLVVSHLRHRARQLLGLLRTRLGRLVVLGPSGKCFLHAMVDEHCVDSFLGGDREARLVQELDGIAGDLWILFVVAGNLSSAFGCVGICACFRQRSESWFIYSDIP